jgi:hydroxymethylpyrimidine/phosphomethylpyrimidine kinase
VADTPTVALTIAGSDSGGGAGLQADLKTFAALGVFGTCAVTAVTAQNTTAVTDVATLDPAFVIAQIQAVVSDLPVAATKTGMLATPAIVTAVAGLAADGLLPNLVVDPVLVSSTGHPLMDEGGVAAYREHLIPRAFVVTPNLRETAVLTGRSLADLATVEDMEAAGQQLRALGAEIVVVKGGHLAVAATERAQREGPVGEPPGGGALAGSPDVVVGPGGTVVLPGQRVETRNDHGTGCSLAAGITAWLARGEDPLEAVRQAKVYVHQALCGAATWRLGGGHGPIDHFGWSAG